MAIYIISFSVPPNQYFKFRDIFLLHMLLINSLRYNILLVYSNNTLHIKVGFEHTIFPFMDKWVTWARREIQ